MHASAPMVMGMVTVMVMVMGGGVFACLQRYERECPPCQQSMCEGAACHEEPQICPMMMHTLRRNPIFLR